MCMEEYVKIFTNREKEILRLLSTGMTNREIAVELSLSEITVKKAVSEIFLKTGMKNRVSLIVDYLKHF
jgi:two-component system, NarL family, nitrate/nitrite response regulator NarP